MKRILKKVSVKKEEVEREEWDRPIEFILSLIGCSIGKLNGYHSQKLSVSFSRQVSVMFGDILTSVSDRLITSASSPFAAYLLAFKNGGGKRVSPYPHPR